MFSLGCLRRRALSLACALLLALLAAGQASADHFIAKETIFDCRGCRLSKAYMDVSRGYPILLTTMISGENLEETSGLLYIRTLGQTAGASQGAVSLAGEGSGWVMTKINLDPVAAFDAILGNTGGACGGDQSLDECIKLLFLATGDDGQATATNSSLTLDGSGNVTGSLSCGSDLVPGLTGTPSWLDTMITPDGNTHVAWWDQSGLNYTTQQGGTWLNDPVLLAANDEIDWPSGAAPPTDMGYYEVHDGDSPYPVLATDLVPGDGFMNIITAVEDAVDDMEPEFQETPVDLPEGVETDENSTFEVDEGGDKPGATLTANEKIVRTDGLTACTPYYYDPDHTDWIPVYVVNIRNGNRSYSVQYWPDDGVLKITISEHDGCQRTAEAFLTVGTGYPSSSVLEGAKMDENGHIHIAMKNTEDSDEHYEGYEWTEVTIDHTALDWSDTTRYNN